MVRFISGIIIKNNLMLIGLEGNICYTNFLRNKSLERHAELYKRIQNFKKLLKDKKN